MNCHGLWYGGSSYAAPDGHDPRDWERFTSIKAAAAVFEARADFDPFYPCVDREYHEDGGGAELHVYLCEEYHEDGPDRIVRFGPRGGVRVERA